MKPTQLIDRAKSSGFQIGKWTNDQEAVDFVTDIAKKGPGTYEVKLPNNVKGQAFLPNGTEIPTDMAVIVVRPNGGVTTAYPYNSAYPRTKSINIID